MPEPNVIARFRASLRNLRFRLGISQEELANRADLHRTYIAGVEGGTRNITLKSIHKLASALEVSIPDLLSDPDDPACNTKNGRQPVEILLAETHVADVTLTLKA